MNKGETLARYFGYTAFRAGQEPLIDALAGGRDALGVMPTGAGKSLCFQIPALMGDGVALVISPLISLMKDQVQALVHSGVAAAYLNSSLTASQSRLALSRACEGRYKIIYVAPERLDVPEFADFARNARLSLIAVDEAHCVSQWGHDFRPSYLRVADFIDALPVRPPVGAFTATATQAVRSDIVRLLRLRDPETRVTGFDRPNLYLESGKPRDRYKALTDILRARAGASGIVYCGTRKAVEEVCDKLTDDGFSATRYHAGLSDAERRDNQDDFRYDRRLVMVATNAFGMGIDKSNVSFVIHYNMPKDLESYYQEAGRAGRDGEDADCVLLYGAQDIFLNKWLIEHGDDNPELTDAEKETVKRRALERMWRMNDYAKGASCLRGAILAYFGEPAGGDCGNCSFCRGGSKFAAVPEPTRTRAPKEKDDPLFEALRAERSRIAREMGVPAYVVFADATLRAMAEKKPNDADELLAVPGVGLEKRKRYGEMFLRVIREGRDPAADQYNLDGTPKMPERGGQGWTKGEDDRLRAEWEAAFTVEQICRAHMRTRGAIQSRLKRLGLM